MLIGPDGQSAEPPHAAPPPPPPPPKKPPAAPAQTSAQTASSGSFNSAVQAARAARAAADGQPPWTHGYETATQVQPGDTMYGIATAHHVPLPDEEADNAQIPNPNLLFSGQVVFSPQQSPVNAATTAKIEAAEEADAAAAQAPANQHAALQHASQQQWAQVQSAIANDLRAQAGGKLLPDKVVQPTVNALNQWAIGSDKLRQATQAAYHQVDGEWQKQGITSSQLAPVLQARQAAVQDDSALSHLRPPTNRAIVQGEQSQASQAWQKVQQSTQQWLLNTAGTKAFPEVGAAQRVKQLDALFPGDTKFATANRAALQSATQTWNSLGITHAKLDPVLNAYHGLQTAEQQKTQALQNPHWHNEDPNAPAQLNQQIGAAQTRLQGAIETQLNDAAAQSNSPQGRSLAMLQREAILQTVGPQTASFRNAVDAADTDLQVTKPAQQVAKAYQQGGAQAGAQALLTATRNAGAAYAGRIIAASKPTIESMAADLNSIARNASGPPIPRGGAFLQQRAQAQFQSVYGDLSAAVEQTDHGTSPKSLSPETRQAADLVANAIAAHMQTGGTFSNPANFYADAAQESVGNGQGASVSLALADALHQRGQTANANLVTEGASIGYDQLKTRTDGDVTQFAKVVSNLEQLRASWSPFMNTKQLDAATAGYASHNPGFVQQFAQTLGTVQQDGAEIVQARQAFTGYSPSLGGLQNYKDLHDAAANLTGTDRSTLFATQESGLATLDVARALQPTVPGSNASISTALDAPGFARSVRTFINQYLKSENTTPNYSPSLKLNLTLSAAGLALTTPTALSELQHFNQLDAGGKAVAFYNGLGFAKYSTEVLSQSAQTSLTRFLGAAAQGKVVNWLSGVKGSNGFAAFSSFYYLEGAFANGVSAEEAASSGDPWSAGLDSGNALGNVLLAANAGKGFIASAIGIDASADTAINSALDWAGPVGAGISVIAQTGLLLHSALAQKHAQDVLQSPGQQFLEDGLHLNPATASALADVSDNQHLGPARVLQAYANQYHIQPQSLLKAMNGQDPADVQNFVYLCELMSPGSNGSYKATDPSDTRNLDYLPGIPFANTVPIYGDSTGDLPNPPASLRQLHYWAETIFGPQSAAVG